MSAATFQRNDEPAIRAPWNFLVAAALCGLWLLLSRLASEVLPNTSAWYPPAALVAAACIVWGGRALIPLLVGSFIAVEVQGHPGEPLWRVMLLSLALKSSYWLAAWALRKLRFDPSFPRPADVARFTMAMAAAALLGGYSGREGERTPSDARRRMLGAISQRRMWPPSKRTSSVPTSCWSRTRTAITSWAT